jgi:hypothetical protein
MTAAGERQLAAERASWNRASSAVNWIMGAQRPAIEAAS